VTPVVDASMTIAWLFDDERIEAAHAVMRPVVAEGAIVPSLWRLEVANVLRNAMRRGRCNEAFVDRSLARLARLAIERDEETDDHAWGSTRTLARKENLSLYDAAYLELAIRSRMSLASCEKALLAAAIRRKVEVFAAGHRRPRTADDHFRDMAISGKRPFGMAPRDRRV
jgi:predicted nucleic acid-binding protein